MKKGLWVVAASFALLLGACSQDTTSDTTTAPSTSSTDVQQTQDDGVQQYKNDLTQKLPPLATVLSHFGDLNIQASSDASLFQDNNWRTDMAVTLVQMKTDITNIQAENTPSSWQDVGDMLNNAMNEIQYVADNYAKALDDVSPSEIADCTNHMNQGNADLSQVTALIQSK